MQKEKVRVYSLARELNMESNDLLEICQQAGLDLKNQLSSLDPEQRDQIVELVKRGTSASRTKAEAKQAAVMPRVVKKTMRTLETRPRTSRETESAGARDEAKEDEGGGVAVAEEEAPDAAAESEVETDLDSEQGTGPADVSKTDSVASQAAAAATPSGKGPARVGEKKIRDLRKTRGEREKPRPQPRTLRPAPASIAAPPPLKKPEKKAKKEPDEATQKPVLRLDADTLRDMERGKVRLDDLLQGRKDAQPKPDAAALEEEEKARKKKQKRRGGVGDREERKKAREARASQRKLRDVSLDHGQAKEFDEDDRKSARSRVKSKKKKRVATVVKQRQGKVTIEPPITVRSLCEALGVKSGPMLFKLLNDFDLDRSVNINTTVDREIAEEIALEEGCELEVKQPPDVEQLLRTQVAAPSEANELVTRAPVVTVMGHVDHGKTSLLDRIRKTNVVDTEVGGITQVLRAWRVEHDGRPITFLDTPGHEAFTKMRARGAEVTDIAVIVVAADDGVMPQTQEAINHAKAAGVSLAIAINKVDLPNANVNKTRQELYSLDVLPDNMGGETPFVETSAATGAGIDDLLDNISLLAELKELKANPNRPGQGVCLEAMLSEGEGVQATLLVREGTLRRGDVIFCGPSYGRVRQMYDDHGRPIDEAGPSVPVRITGLDRVPNADDPFMAAPDLAVAREIAENRQQRQLQATLTPRAPLDFSSLTKPEITELKVILKADFRGSIEALRKELEKLEHEEVRVKLLHAGIGGISESDVQLALTSPEDTMIVGFNVVPDERARALAEAHGVPLREYNVIYMLTDDIKAALEGKLKPRQEIVHLGRAVVRDTFKISRVGTIAGCYVTQGLIQRSSKVRVIRDGAVIYPPPGKTAGLDSLKRFKDDVSEVREGFECGLKVAGYDDIKVDDVIEAFRIEEIKRTLDG